MKKLITVLAVMAATLAAATSAMADTIVKSSMVFPTVAARDDFISDANAAIAGQPLRQGVQAFVGTGDEVGPTVARVKVTLINNGQAQTVAGVLINQGNIRGVLTGSFVRATRDDGTVIREFYW